MKKITVFILALSTILTFAGCSHPLPANEYNAQSNETANAAEAPAVTQNPDLILANDTVKKWKEDYERDKVAIDGIALEKPGYHRVDFKYYYIKQNENGKNQITLEMEVTNLSNMDYSVFDLVSDTGARTAGNGNIEPIHTSPLDEPGMMSSRSNDVIRAGGKMTVILSYGLKDLESDVELSVNAQSQKTRMYMESDGKTNNEPGLMEPETAILKIK